MEAPMLTLAYVLTALACGVALGVAWGRYLERHRLDGWTGRQP